MFVVAILFHRADEKGRPAGRRGGAQARARVINRLIIGRFLGRIVAAMDRKCELLRRAFTRANCCISDPRRGLSFSLSLSLSLLARNWIAFFVTARKDPIVWGRARFSRPAAQLYRCVARVNRWIIYGGVIVSLLFFFISVSQLNFPHLPYSRYAFSFYSIFKD